jgi:hypothetical protein
MVYAVDSFLNNAVDLYIQAVEYCRISTSQILTPVGAGIRQTYPVSEDTVPDSGQNGRTPDIWPDPAVLAESPASPAVILLERWDPGLLVRNQLGRPVSDQLAEIRLFFVGFLQLCQNLYLPNIKKKLYYFILIFFIL